MTVRAVVKRKDGTIEDLGTISEGYIHWATEQPDN